MNEIRILEDKIKNKSKIIYCDIMYTFDFSLFRGVKKRCQKAFNMLTTCVYLCLLFIYSLSVTFIFIVMQKIIKKQFDFFYCMA